jgi:hypothetical protein
MNMEEKKDFEYYMSLKKSILASKCMRVQKQIDRLSPICDVSDVLRIMGENASLNRQMSHIDEAKDLVRAKLDELGVKYHEVDSMKNYVKLLLDAIK